MTPLVILRQIYKPISIAGPCDKDGTFHEVFHSASMEIKEKVE